MKAVTSESSRNEALSTVSAVIGCSANSRPATMAQRRRSLGKRRRVSAISSQAATMCPRRLSSLNTAGWNDTMASSMYVSVQKGRQVPSRLAPK